MSVIIGDEVLASGRTADSVLARHGDFALAFVTVEVVQELGLRVERQPQPDEPCHAVVVGHKTRGTSRALAKSSKWVVPPPG